MRKLLLLLIISLLFSCKKEILKKEYYSVLIYEDTFGGRYLIEEEIDTIFHENDTLALINNYESYLVRKVLDEIDSSRYMYTKTKIIDHRLLNNKNQIISSFLSDSIKYVSEKRVRKSVLEIKNTSIEKSQNIESDNIGSQFSNYDGSHIILSEYIKNNLNDPDSYFHVETSYNIKDDYIGIKTIFRAKNAYNATITKTVLAKSKKDTGQLIEVSGI
jgi:hypothetical protein